MSAAVPVPAPLPPGFDVAFWDRFHEGSKVPYEWFLSPSAAVAELIGECVRLWARFPPSHPLPVRLLHVGSGLSTLGECLLEVISDTFTFKVVNVDASEEALAFMNSRFPTSTYVRGNLLNLSEGLLEADLSHDFDIAVDKGTLDAVISNSVETGRRVVAQIRQHLVDGGLFCVFSGAPWERRRELFPPRSADGDDGRGWELVAVAARFEPETVSGKGFGENLVQDGVPRLSQATLDSIEADITVFLFVVRAV